MASRIEQIIEEIEEYIDGCKPQTFSSSKIIVNRETMEELLNELRTKTPEEIKRYQRIISNKEAILADAQAKADSIIAQAQIKTDELVSEHQIMQQAYEQANEVVDVATRQAQELINSATTDSNTIRLNALSYTDDILKKVEEELSQAIRDANASHEAYIKTLKKSLEIVKSNRAELAPPAAQPQKPAREKREEPPKDEAAPDVIG